MLKRLLLIVALVPLLYVSPVYAQWRYGSTVAKSSIYCTKSEAYSGTLQQISATQADASWYAYDVEYDSNLYSGCPSNEAYYASVKYSYNADPDPDDPFSQSYSPITPIYNFSYTDEQCQAQYGGSFTRIYDITEAEATAGVTLGACTFTADPDDLECYSNTVGGETANFCYSTWALSSSGQTNDPGGNEVASDNDVPDYLTATDDTSTCEHGSVAYGGQSYCYSEGAADNLSTIGGDIPGVTDGDSSTDDSSGIDWGSDDGSDSGSNNSVTTPGTSTGSDGSPLGMGQGDPDGDGEGDSTLGDIAGILNGIRGDIRTGFDSVVDALSGSDIDEADAQEALAKAGFDDTTTAMDQAGEELDQAFDDAREQVGDGKESSIAEKVTSHLPSLPDRSCSPLVFGQGKYEFTVSCKPINTIQSWLTWLLYFWTAYNIINLFLDRGKREA